MVNEQGEEEHISYVSQDGSRLAGGYGRNIDAELKNIFSPIRARNTPRSNASSASYGTPEHTTGHQSRYYEPRAFPADAYYNPAEYGNLTRSSEILMARPNSSGPSVFMREYGRVHRYDILLKLCYMLDLT